MVIYKWSILGIETSNDLITSAKYSLTATQDDKSVLTEGNWTFTDPVLSVALGNVTEAMIVSWIDSACIKDGVSVIKSRLEEQLAYVDTSARLPWKQPVFTLG